MAIKQLVEKVEPVFFKDGIYVLVPLEKIIEYDDEVEGSLALAEEEKKIWLKQIDEECFYRYNGKNQYTEIFLYGSRVSVRIDSFSSSTYYNSFKVDGKNILLIDNMGKVVDLSGLDICHLLNAIETYGVEGFMEKYSETLKTSLIALNELIEKHILLRSEDDKDQKLLVDKQRTLQSLLEQFSALLFLVLQTSLHFKLGLENEQIRNLSSAIVEQFA